LEVQNACCGSTTFNLQNIVAARDSEIRKERMLMAQRTERPEASNESADTLERAVENTKDRQETGD